MNTNDLIHDLDSLEEHDFPVLLESRNRRYTVMLSIVPGKYDIHADEGTSFYLEILPANWIGKVI